MTLVLDLADGDGGVHGGGGLDGLLLNDRLGCLVDVWNVASSGLVVLVVGLTVAIVLSSNSWCCWTCVLSFAYFSDVLKLSSLCCKSLAYVFIVIMCVLASLNTYHIAML